MQFLWYLAILTGLYLLYILLVVSKTCKTVITNQGTESDFYTDSLAFAIANGVSLFLTCIIGSTIRYCCPLRGEMTRPAVDTHQRCRWSFCDCRKQRSLETPSYDLCFGKRYVAPRCCPGACTSFFMACRECQPMMVNACGQQCGGVCSTLCSRSAQACGYMWDLACRPIFWVGATIEWYWKYRHWIGP
jgi:hypothetical protein